MRNEDYATKIGWCGFCNQGWLEIMKTTKTNKLIIACSECSTIYDSPEEALRCTVPYLPSGKHDKSWSIERVCNIKARPYDVEAEGFIINPSIAELEEADWLRYVIV